MVCFNCFSQLSTDLKNGIRDVGTEGTLGACPPPMFCNYKENFLLFQKVPLSRNEIVPMKYRSPKCRMLSTVLKKIRKKKNVG